jgi:hypothetical protein
MTEKQRDRFYLWWRATIETNNQSMVTLTKDELHRMILDAVWKTLEEPRRKK